MTAVLVYLGSLHLFSICCAACFQAHLTAALALLQCILQDGGCELTSAGRQGLEKACTRQAPQQGSAAKHPEPAAMPAEPATAEEPAGC